MCSILKLNDLQNYIYQNHLVSVFEAINMVPIKFLVALAAIYDGILYVVQPPHCSSASFAYIDEVHNVTWRKMDNTSLANISVFKVPVKNVSESGVLTFKIKYLYPTYAVDTNWQTILVKNKPDVLKKLVHPADNSCCVSTVVLSIILLITVCMCVTYFFICWSYNKLQTK